MKNYYLKPDDYIVIINHKLANRISERGIKSFNGQLNNKSIIYNIYGIKQDELDYQNNMRHGQYILYANRIVIRIFNYQYNKLHGKSIRFNFDDGNKYCEIDYKDDMKNGKEIWYYRNGNKRDEADYQNNKKYGKEIWYHENGEIEFDCNYENDELIDCITKKFI